MHTFILYAICQWMAINEIELHRQCGHFQTLRQGATLVLRFGGNDCTALSVDCAAHRRVCSLQLGHANVQTVLGIAVQNSSVTTAFGWLRCTQKSVLSTFGTCHRPSSLVGIAVQNSAVTTTFRWLRCTQKSVLSTIGTCNRPNSLLGISVQNSLVTTTFGWLRCTQKGVLSTVGTCTVQTVF